MYLDDFADGSYRWVSSAPTPVYPYVDPYVGEEKWAEVMGTSTDLSHVAFTGVRGLVYMLVGGDAVPVGVANNGEPMNASVGESRAGEVDEVDAWHAVSSSGSRVFFTSPASGGQLYVRENAEQKQSALNAQEKCTEPALACTVTVSAGTARYWGASADGSKVFFTEGKDLYEYDVESGQTMALTSGGEVRGVVQISEEGSYVYFVAKGALTGQQENSRGAKAESGKPNLYLSHAGNPTFIATLAAGDEADWNGPSNRNVGSGPEDNDAVVTPSGTLLAFSSTLELTGYDNHDANSGEPDNEIYLYDTETGSLVCASCNPTGAAPIGSSSLPSPSGNASPDAEHRPRDLTENGVLFFDSDDALVPHASDGRQNVYEYEDGHVYPISDVAGGYESFFLDASVNGEDVFFATADQLVTQDQGNRVAVYDARVGGGFPATVAAPACTTAEACRAASPPTPASTAPRQAQPSPVPETCLLLHHHHRRSSNQNPRRRRSNARSTS